MKKRKITEVLVTTKEKRLIREFFQVSHGTVNDALSGKTKSYLADSIRRMAKELGGVERDVIITEKEDDQGHEGR